MSAQNRLIVDYKIKVYVEKTVLKSSKPDTVFIDENGHVYAREKGAGKFSTKINGKTVTISVKVSG